MIFVHLKKVGKKVEKLKKVGKISRPFRYDLNQIPYDYTVEVTNRFKGLNIYIKLFICHCILKINYMITV